SCCINWGVVAVEVKVCQSVRHADDSDDAPVGGCYPESLTAVVISRWNEAAYRKADEVFHVEGDRLIETDLFCTSRESLVCAELHRISIGACRRQLRWHGLGPVWSYRVLCGPYAQRGDGLWRAVWQYEAGRGPMRDEQRGLARAVAVGDHT